MKLKKRLRLVPSCSRNRVRITDLAPDGVLIVVDWDKFTVGSSVFVPAINLTELIAQFYEIADLNKWYIEHRFRIENKKQGIRFWRML